MDNHTWTSVFAVRKCSDNMQYHVMMLPQYSRKLAKDLETVTQLDEDQETKLYRIARNRRSFD